MSTSDVESFTGKIVCNIDGSSYIIDAENATLSSLNHNSLCVAAISVTNEKTSILQTTKTATKSFEKSTKTTTTKNFSSSNYDQQHLNDLQQTANPKIHTFRVVSANDASIQLRQENKILKIQKPILMCFICKLSFGITKSFSLHANSEHGLDLQDLEKHLLTQREYSSAIIQKNMDENPQISFLEPVSIETPTLGVTSFEDCSGMDSQLDSDKLTNLNDKICGQSSKNPQNVNFSVSSAAADNIPSSNASSSSSSKTSCSSSSPLSPCCTTNSIITTSTTTTIAITSDKPQVIMSPIYDDQQSQCAYDSAPKQTHITSTSIASTTLSSLNLDKSKTNNYNISIPLSDHLTTSDIATTTNNTTISVTSSTSTFTSTPTATIAISLPSTTNVATSSLSINTGVDLTATSGNLSIDANSTDSLVDINKYNNSDNSNSNNDSIEPHTQHINNVIKSSNLSPKSHQNQHLSTNINTSIMGDFLQQHLQRIAGSSRIADDETQHKHLEHERMSWSLPIENTFSSPVTASNVSAAQISSLHTSLSALNSDQNSTNSVKLISEFLQQQLVAAQHQKQLTYPFSHVDMSLNLACATTANTSAPINACPEHTEFKGIDCKSCEMLEVHQNIKQSPQITPQRSPSSSSLTTTGMAILTPANQLPMSPNNSQNANNMLPGLNSSINTSPLNTPGCAASFTIGACSDHINGRPLGVECARCEMILNSARLNSNVQMSTRNSCKTLKCPQCNWHYKYQETLEIHMREKHPDGESACGYCLAGQQHPRLARGESYSCGYKPYRCEICNYSTTTKGNLSIHMQSDKHLNNMQELNSSQNMVAAAVAVATGGVGKLETTPKITINSLAQQQQQHQQQRTLGNSSNNANISASLTSAVVCGASSTSLQLSNVLPPGNGGISGVVGGVSIKPKPSFRCDICSYETSVARNLRIHMTSEKHTHNMAVLQNNIKHIQAFSFLHLQKQQQQQQPEVALADLAYNQALMIQLLHQNAAATAQTQSQPPGSCPLDNSPVAMVATKEVLLPKVTSPTTPTEIPPSPYSPKSNDLNLNELGATKTIEPPINPDMWPTTLFSCLVCSNFNTNNLDELNQHLIIDRSRQMATSQPNSSISPTPSNIGSTMTNSNSPTGTMYFSDILMVQNNNYICRLCNYKTNLKANFQLHSKTDKHLQKLNFINHLREGGARNEYKLLYYQQQQQQIGANTVQIKCNSCDFYTNSIQKLSLHTQHMRHETMIMIFQHLNYLVQQQHASSSASNDASSINISSDTAPHSLVDGAQITTTTTVASAVDCSNTGINKSLHCHLCNFKANSLLEMIQHVKSIRHLQVEQFVCLQRRSEQLETPSLDDVFKLCDKSQPNNDPTAATTSTTPTQTNNIMDNKAAVCFSSLIETGNDDYSNKISFEHSEGNDNIIKNVDNKTNLSSSASLMHHSKDSGDKQTSTDIETNSNVTTNNIPSIIYKCSHCDYFGQMKNEVELHIDSMHPNADSEDVISIPTNPVAIQAFQAAMAAATLAAVSRASTTSYTRSPLVSPNTTQTKLSPSLQEDDDDMRPVAVKRERLDLGDQETATIIQDKNPNMDVVEQQEVVLHTTQEQHGRSVQCPLCQEYFSEKQTLESHLMTIHSVNTDGLARLLLMVDTSVWQTEDVPTVSRTHTTVNETTTTSSKVFNDMQVGPKQSLNVYELLQCQQCGSTFKHEQQLLQHAQKMQHYTQQQGEYLCLASNSSRNRCVMHFPTQTAMFNHYNDTHMSLVISERHVYKYRCKQCSLAFKTQEKLSTHTLYHTMRDATKCTMCQRNFRSIQSLQKHMEQVHSQMPTAGNSSECSSPRTMSPSGSEVERPIPQASRSTSTSDKIENESIRSVTPGQDLCPAQSPGSNLIELQTSTSLSNHQQQQMAALTALIKQQQTPPPSEILHHLQMQHHQQLQNLPALHNLQQMQQQLAAAAAASGMPLNPVEMLNLMQFHHLMSLNFMNLAPPLIFGGNTAAATVSSGSTSNPTTSTNIPNSISAQPQNSTISSTDLTTASTSAGSNAPVIAALPNVDVNVQIMQQQQISPGASNSQLTNNQKRARTRITDEQLKILRAHFDINNSPSEESILEMSQKANLPMKVVKHWFRNTLFKERQRNKDSPYNFNNPPSTTLNLEEYERTGQTKVIPLVEQMQQQPQIPSRPSSAHSNSNISEYSSQQQQQQQQQLEQKLREDAETLRSQASSVASLTYPLDVQIKTEPGEDLTTSTTIQTSASVMSNFLKQHQQQKVRFPNLEQSDHDITLITEQHLSSAALAAASAAAQQQHVAAVAAATFYNSYETKSESGSSEIHSRPQTPNSNTTSNLYASMNDLLSQQLENMPLNQMGPPKKFQLNPSTNPCANINSTSERSTNLSQTSGNVSGCSSGGITISSKLFEKNSPSAQYDTNSNSSNSSTTSSGKRANRTRFTDYQIKVLQEFFENNSYPKDSDLEYLSKLLLLSPRVIVVWFQNARQKQRKIYENQPNNSLYESEEKKQNINYACKKCSLVFQRYYELIRHQKNHCFKEENNKKSAKAQIAAAQIAQNLSSEDSNSSIDINNAAAAALLAQHNTVVATPSLVKNTSSASEFSPLPSNTTPPRDQSSNSNNDKQKFDCDKCKMTFSHFEHLREHQLMHLVNPNLHLPGENTTAAASAVAAYGPFGSILQSLQQAAHLQQAAASSANMQTAAKKRKYSETSSNADEVSSLGGFSITGVDYDSHAKKYNFLYQYFLQNEGNSELRQQFHTHDSSELNMEFLANFYQQTELKKRNNYDFLFQYYIRNEQQTNANFELADNNKPNIEFLLQYYQLCESKKFFQLEASPQRIHDGTLTHAGILTSQHNNTSISNSSRLASNDSNSSSHGGSEIYEESNGREVLNNSPQEKSYSNIELNTHQNGQHSNNNNNDSLETEKDNLNFSPKITEDSTSHCASKLEEQMDQLDGLQEVKNPSNSKQTMPITITSPLHLQSDPTFSAGTYYQNLEDFLDATMIENHNQTLTFPSGSNNKEVLKPSQYPPTSPTNTYTIQPAASDTAENHKQTNKRLRTTILPEQLNFLYECYQNESNPSRKMLEEIAKKVNLKKRVVQVWFQNSRAKDKKSRNQHRKHFSNISDDNSNSSNMTNNTNKANVPSVLTTPLPTVTTGSEQSNDIIRDCNLCQVSQVNIQQHAFTVEHIRNVKKLLAQTKSTAAVTLLNSSRDDDNEQSDFAQLIQNDKNQQTAHHQEQLALMMMAFQSQHMTGTNSSIFNAMSVGNNDTAAKYDSVELAMNNFSSKCSIELTKAKRNSIKKKKNIIKNMTATKKPLTTNEPIADTVANDSEIFLNFNANLAGNFTLNPSTDIRSIKEHKTLCNRVNILTLGHNENDGNNNHDEESEAKQLDNVEFPEGGNHNKNNSETIENANDVSKLYGYNQISAFERVRI